MPKRKLTKHEDDIRRGLRSPDSIPPYGKVRKSAENSPDQSPHDGIHTCSRGCSKPGCTRALRDTIKEQDEQIEALKRDLLEATADKRKKAMETVHDLNHIGGLQEENARLKAEVDAHKKYISEWAFGDYVPVTEVTRLKAEVERLTKAGDWLIEAVQTDDCWENWDKGIAKWNAAKEGGQP